MGKMSCLTVLFLAGIMGISVPITSLASNPPFARSEEEWARLQDNVLEYEEIGDLIEEYNATVQSNQYEYHHFINEYGRTRDDIADSYRDLADDLESSMTDDEGMGMISDFQLELQAKQMREQADNQMEDSHIYYLTYSQVEDSLAMSAQSYFISYYRSQLELESARDQLELLKNQEALTFSRQQAGMATQADVLGAQEAVINQEKIIADTAAQTERIRQSLIVLCGWKGSDQPEICPVPDVDLAELEAIDLEADTQLAEENNYTLRINQRKLENALEADNKASLERTIAGNRRQIGVSVTAAWQDLQASKRSWEQALLEQTAAERNLALAQQKWSVGMITDYDYESQQSTFLAAQRQIQTAKLNLLESLETYRWNVKGLANAG